MKLNLSAFQSSGLGHRIRGMFNLNDPRWGRSGDKPSEGDQPEPPRPDAEPPLPPSGNSRGSGQGAQPGSTGSRRVVARFQSQAGRLFGGARGGGRGGKQRRWRRRLSATRHEERRAGGRSGCRRSAADLAGHRLFHRPGRPAGCHHPVWQIQLHGGCRFQLAPAVSRCSVTKSWW